MKLHRLFYFSSSAMLTLLSTPVFANVYIQNDFKPGSFIHGVAECWEDNEWGSLNYACNHRVTGANIFDDISYGKTYGFKDGLIVPYTRLKDAKASLYRIAGEIAGDNPSSVNCSFADHQIVRGKDYCIKIESVHGSSQTQCVVETHKC